MKEKLRRLEGPGLKIFIGEEAWAQHSSRTKHEYVYNNDVHDIMLGIRTLDFSAVEKNVVGMKFASDAEHVARRPGLDLSQKLLQNDEQTKALLRAVHAVDET